MRLERGVLSGAPMGGNLWAFVAFVDVMKVPAFVSLAIVASLIGASMLASVLGAKAGTKEEGGPSPTT